MTRSQTNSRTFLILIFTQVFSLVGSRMTGFALGIWIYTQTGDATPIALVAFFRYLPYFLSAGVAGALADRWDRRYVMAVGDAGQAAGTVLLLISFASGEFQIWHLYGVTVLQAIFDMLQGPAFSASITLLIADKHRDRANAMRLMTTPAANVAAPAIAGALYGLIDVSGIILIDLLTFVVAFVVVLTLRIPRPEATAEGKALTGSLWTQSLDGFRFVWARRPLFYLFTFTGLTNFFYGGAIALFTPYNLARTGSETTAGIILSAYSLGALTGGLLVSITGGLRPRVRMVMPGLGMTGLMLAIYGTSDVPLLMALACFFMAMFPPMSNTAIITILQIKVPPDLQGRVFAAISQISALLLPLAYLIVGPLADEVFEPAVAQAGWEQVGGLVGEGAGSGMGLIMVISGLIVFGVSVLYYAQPVIRRMETSLPDYEPVVSTPEPTPETALAAD